MRTASGLIGLALLLGFVSCQGSDQASTVEATTSAVRVTTTTGITAPEEPPLTAEGKLLGWIRSCEARWIVFAHSGLTYVKFRGAATIRLRLDDSAFGSISTAADAQSCEKRITVGIE
jgi:hypothetical protein